MSILRRPSVALLNLIYAYVALSNLRNVHQGVGVGVADIVKASALHVDTAVVVVRVPGPAKGKTHIGQTPAQKLPQLCGRISVEDRRCQAELDL